MDTAPANSSAAIPAAPAIPVTPPTPVTVPVSVPKPHTGVWIHSIFTIVFFGILIGVACALYSVVYPSNRLVVFDQNYSTYFIISSVRLKQPGLVMLYFNDATGLIAEDPHHLPAGYFTNVAIPVSRENLESNSPREMHYVARLLPDTGDGIIHDTLDRILRDMFGRRIDNSFYVSSNPPLRPFPVSRLLDMPVTYLTNVLFP